MTTVVTRHSWMLLLLAAGVPLAVLFGTALVTTRSFAFRDAAHYYPPLIQEVISQWPHEFPLWNANEERGRPLLADPTAAVLYPGQLVFALPLSFRSAYELYVVGHVLLCFITCYLAARRLAMRREAATLAGVCYAYGASILFEYCNLPYLIGAAWLPWGIASIVALIQSPSRRGIWEVAVTVALMVLGGDPETAYLLGVAGGGAALAALWSLYRQQGLGKLLTVGTSVGGRLLAAGCLATALSAAQWLPTLEWRGPVTA